MINFIKKLFGFGKSEEVEVVEQIAPTLEETKPQPQKRTTRKTTKKAAPRKKTTTRKKAAPKE